MKGWNFSLHLYVSFSSDFGPQTFYWKGQSKVIGNLNLIMLVFTEFFCFPGISLCYFLNFSGCFFMQEQIEFPIAFIFLLSKVEL